MKEILIVFVLIEAFLCLDKRIHLEIYTEMLCPDTRRFFDQSFKHAFETKDFHKMVKITTIPFGKATIGHDREVGVVIKCHHGEKECYGNKIQSCGMSMIPHEYDKIRFFTCTQTKINLMFIEIDRIAEECSRSAKLDFKKVKSCADSKEGFQLLHQAGRKTAALTQKPTHIPWVTVNGKYSYEDEQHIFKDLLAWTCKNYDGDAVVDACYHKRKKLL